MNVKKLLFFLSSYQNIVSSTSTGELFPFMNMSLAEWEKPRLAQLSIWLMIAPLTTAQEFHIGMGRLRQYPSGQERDLNLDPQHWCKKLGIWARVRR